MDQGPIVGTASLSMADGVHVFDVWSRQQFLLSLGSDGEVHIHADSIRLRAESEFVESAIVALSEAVTGVSQSMFTRRLVISPAITGVTPEPTAVRQGKVGFRVSASLPESFGLKLRAFYDSEVRANLEVIIARARVAVAPADEQKSFDFDQGSKAAIAASAVVGDEAVGKEVPRTAVCAVDQGNVAREALARELAARLAGKSYAFSLATEAGDVTTCQGRFAAAQRQSTGEERRVLFGHINALSKRPAEIRIVASDSSQDRGRSWLVSYEYSEPMVKKLAALLAMPTKSLEFEVRFFNESSVQGKFVRAELIDCRPVQSVGTPAANEPGGCVDPLVHDPVRRAA